MSAPTIPPRPSRAQAAAGPTEVKQEMPPIPPRPVRKIDPSPSREEYTRSPLNALPNTNGRSQAPFPPPAQPEVPRRPSAFSMPAEVGQEGLEYTSYDQLPPDAHGVEEESAATPSEQTRSADVPMHAPKASLPVSSAKARIATVTRTDSTTAAAAGIGHAKGEDEAPTPPSELSSGLSRVISRTYGGEQLGRVPSADPHPLRQQASFSTGLTRVTSRPGSVHSVDPHHGEDNIPRIGQQIPLYPNAGDVQAPSPAQTQSQHAPGIGFFNDGSTRAHNRKRSSRQEFATPDHYGLHGHAGAIPQDQFERAWLAKHPEEAAKMGQSPYLLKPETALSREQLDLLVHQDGEAGFGTNPNMIGIPSQDIAFKATDAFASRGNTPNPIGELKKRGSSSAADSPLRKASLPVNQRHSQALESEDEDSVHIDPDTRLGDKITGGGDRDDAVNLDDEVDELGDGVPILASDELVKRPSSAFLQPAVSPEMSRAGDDEHYESDTYGSNNSRRNSWQPPSRPNSRPGSVHGAYHGGPLHRFISHDEHHGSGMGTPLEEIEEYEPLFPEDDEEKQVEQKAKMKQRPGLINHHFPSQDVWEDTPSSLQYQTYVDSPELEPPAEKIAEAGGAPAKIFETPEQEQKRITQNPEDMMSDNKTFAKPHFKAGVLEEYRAGGGGGRPMVQRFPSSDIWEDSPDSMKLETTVSGPQMDREALSPPDDSPSSEARSLEGVLLPSIPTRPERKSKLAQEITPDLPPNKQDEREQEVPDLGVKRVPSIPDRPKPKIPERPTRATAQADAPLAKSISREEGASPGAPKIKPAVPARPTGSKIAALQGGFMNDLNQRLRLGPQAPPVSKPLEDTTSEKEPLVDARKSRAKGPARRKPASSPASAGANAGFGFSVPVTVWEISEIDDEVKVPTLGHAQEVVEKQANVPTTEPLSSEGLPIEEHEKLEKIMTAHAEENTTAAGPISPSGPEDTNTDLPTVPGAFGDTPDPSISAEIAQSQAAIEPELEKSLAAAEPAPASAEAVTVADEAAAKGVAVTSEGVQTGEHEIVGTGPMGEKSHFTAFVGGRAPEEGNVVVRGAEEGRTTEGNVDA